LKKLSLKFNEQGLLPAIVQDSSNGQVLMMAWMNAEAFEHTLATGLAHFWSRSRQTLWLKGATSGNYLYINEVWADCDQDTLLLRVNPDGPACHTGETSCFYRKVFPVNNLSEETL
jgi:phosphoribosyl-AMP cyclohydrolase